MGGIAMLMSGVTNTSMSNQKSELVEISRVAHEPTLYNKVVMSITHRGGMISATNIISKYR